jgi:hypothetical protein
MAIAVATAAAMLAPGAAHAAPGWIPAETVQAPSAAGALSLATADDGTTIAVWSATEGGHLAIEAAVRLPGGRFTGPVTLSRAPASECSAPRIAMSRSGDAVVVWQRQDGTDFSLESAARPAGGAWSSAVRVGPDSDKQAMAAKVATSSAGEALAIWEHTGPSGRVIRAARRSPSGAWQQPENVSFQTGGVNVLTPAIAFGAGGEAHAAWIEKSSTTAVVRAALRPPGGRWTVAPPVGGQGAGEVDVSVAPDGTAALVFNDRPPSPDFAVRAATRPPGGSWTSPLKVGTASSIPGDPAFVAMDDARAATIVFVTGTGANVGATRLPPGGTWSTPFDLSRNLFPDVYGLRVTASGTRAVSAWYGQIALGASTQVDHVQVATHDAAGEWSVPQDVGTTAAPPYPQPGVDGKGDAVVGWLDGSKVRLAAEDVSGPDLGVPGGAPVAGESSPLSVGVLDRWSPLQSVTWDFGDGTAGSGPAPMHTYAAPGAYRARVTALDSLDNASSSEGTIIASDPPPPPPLPPPITPLPPPITPTRPGAERSPGTIKVRVRSGFTVPAGASVKSACATKVKLELRRDKTVLGRAAVKLQREGRDCRFSTTFTVRSSRVGSARTLKCIVRYPPTRALDRRTWTITVKPG